MTGPRHFMIYFCMKKLKMLHAIQNGEESTPAKEVAALWKDKYDSATHEKERNSVDTCKVVKEFLLHHL